MYEEMPSHEDLLERARECLAHRSKSWVTDATLFARFLLNERARPLLTHVAFEGASAVFRLQDNRALSIPLAWLPSLEAAAGDRRELDSWELVDRGLALRWPRLVDPAGSVYAISLEAVLGLWDRVKTAP